MAAPTRSHPAALQTSFAAEVETSSVRVYLSCFARCHCSYIFLSVVVLTLRQQQNQQKRTAEDQSFPQCHHIANLCRYAGTVVTSFINKLLITHAQVTRHSIVGYFSMIKRSFGLFCGPTCKCLFYFSVAQFYVRSRRAFRAEWQTQAESQPS